MQTEIHISGQRPSTPGLVSLLSNILPLLVCLTLLSACSLPVTVSDMTSAQAIYANQPPDAPRDVLDQLLLVNVTYYNYHGILSQGQIVVHKALADDIRHAFAVMRAHRFPLENVLPVVHPVRLAKAPPYGMYADNNTSGFVWRKITAGSGISLHALGLAIDINPGQNPYRKGELIIPAGSVYNPSVPGTLTADSPVVTVFKQMGWEWGGAWLDKGTVDYMHFQKIPPGLQTWVEHYKAHGNRFTSW